MYRPGFIPTSQNLSLLIVNVKVKCTNPSLETRMWLVRFTNSQICLNYQRTTLPQSLNLFFTTSSVSYMTMLSVKTRIMTSSCGRRRYKNVLVNHVILDNINKNTVYKNCSEFIEYYISEWLLFNAKWAFLKIYEDDDDVLFILD